MKKALCSYCPKRASIVLTRMFQGTCIASAVCADHQTSVFLGDAVQHGAGTVSKMVARPPAHLSNEDKALLEAWQVLIEGQQEPRISWMQRIRQFIRSMRM